MPTITLDTFKQYIKKIFEDGYEENSDDVLIPVPVANIHSRKDTLNILRENNIKLANIKKFVQLEDDKLVVDNIRSNNVFTSDNEWSEAEKTSLDKDQLIFVEDENDATKVKIYKISFNLDGIPPTISPEFGLVTTIPLTQFNDYFVNSNLFQEEDIPTLAEKVNNLLKNDPNNPPPLVWDITYTYGNTYGNSNLAIVNGFKAATAMQLGNIEADYFVYSEGGKTIIQGITNSSHQQAVTGTISNLTDNDILYFSKGTGTDAWTVHKIQISDIPGRILSSKNYRAFKFNDLTNQQFDDNFKTLKLLDPVIVKQDGFTKAENNDGLLGTLQKEEKATEDSAIELLTRPAVPVAPDLIPNPAVIPVVSPQGRAPAFNEIKAAFNNKEFYHLTIDNNNYLNLSKIANSQSEVIKQNLSTDGINKWNALNVDNKYEKLFFTENEADKNTVKKWILTPNPPNNNTYNLECIGTVDINELRTKFANNNLFHDSVNNLNGIHLGTNGSEEAAKAAQPAVNTPLKPLIVKNVINLKQIGAKNELWDLNVTEDTFKIDKQFKLEPSDNDLLNKLIADNSDCRTVILFNKYTGAFLRAYYFNDNNKKVDCSNKLSDNEKIQLSNINQQAKARVNASPEITIEPIINSLLFAKNKTYKLTYIPTAHGKSARWCIIGKDNHTQLEGKAQLMLTATQVATFYQIVGNNNDIEITFDENHNVKTLTYKNLQNKPFTISSKQLGTDNNGLFATIWDCIEIPKKRIPEDNSKTELSPWSKKALAAVNGPFSPQNIIGKPSNLTQ